MSLLPRVFASTSGVDAPNAAAQLLFDEMGLDYLAIWSARPDGADAPVQMLQLWNGEGAAWPPASMQSSLQMVLSGKFMLLRTDGRRIVYTSGADLFVSIHHSV